MGTALVGSLPMISSSPGPFSVPSALGSFLAQSHLLFFVQTSFVHSQPKLGSLEDSFVVWKERKKSADRAAAVRLSPSGKTNFTAKANEASESGMQ